MLMTEFQAAALVHEGHASNGDVHNLARSSIYDTRLDGCDFLRRRRAFVILMRLLHDRAGCGVIKKISPSRVCPCHRHGVTR